MLYVPDGQSEFSQAYVDWGFYGKETLNDHSTELLEAFSSVGDELIAMRMYRDDQELRKFQEDIQENILSRTVSLESLVFQPTSNLRELDRRVGDGIDVGLLWDPVKTRVFISIADQRNGDYKEFEVPPAKAAEAFLHPYVYAN
jgi:hypothetical protein